MRARAIAILGLSCISLAVGANSMAAQSEKAEARTQTFGTEEPLPHPIALSESALRALESDERSAEILHYCAQQERIRVADIPATWFVATEVALNDDNSPELVVRGQHACLLGAQITQFWILVKSSGEYHTLFTGRADGLKLLSHRTNGHRDVALVQIKKAGFEIRYSIYRYVDGSYRFFASSPPKNVEGRDPLSPTV